MITNNESIEIHPNMNECNSNLKFLLFGVVKKIVGKEENAGHPHFHLF